ncbi:hypothetical protein [Chitinophaga sp. Cy-1792]|uniref:hypothetical protein n=1 Tax=Chitinophaga sp. Cy-1792 TaxID=2608339 RepID=UPI00141DEC57|nr:hypothetical protein [Chitinophaga sp. Cy-1792]NIG56520.1 hypothetical protein [Chitinophaga sp. Cy-1792]
MKTVPGSLQHFTTAELAQARIVLQDKPASIAYLYGKKTERQYQLPTSSITCIPVIKGNAESLLTNGFKALKAGDTVKIYFRSIDQWKLTSSYTTLSILGCEAKGQIFFTPEQLFRWEKKVATRWIYIGACSILLGMAILITKINSWLRENNVA